MAFHLIERREYKYLIDEGTAERVRRAIEPFCVMDAFAASLPRRRYLIESLYLDTPDLLLYSANQHEQCDRFKLRVRRYPEYPGSSVFLEVKRRVNDVVVKTRGRTEGDVSRCLMDPHAPLPPAPTTKDAASIERFFALVHSYRLRPMTLVQYDREAWASTIDSYARVTFDRAIRCQRQERPFFDPDPRAWRPIDGPDTMRAEQSLCVLELKFTTAVPWWMAHIVQRLDLMRRGYSKYCNSILAWHQHPMPRSSRVGG